MIAYILSLILLISSTFAKREVRPTRLLPPDGSILHCAGQVNQNLSSFDQSSIGEFNNYTNYLKNGTKPALFMVYVGLTLSPETLTNWFQELSDILDTYPDNQWYGVQIGLWFYDNFGPQFDCAIANGSMDANIDAMVNGIEKMGRPVWLRIGYEFNGQWTDFVPSCYIAAYQRITTKLRANPFCNKYVANVWDFTADGESTSDHKYTNWTLWYPGDDYVDWWGLNIFSQNASPPPLSQFTTAFAEAAANASFPLMIGESTPRVHVSQCDPSPCTSWTDWYEPYFNFINNDTYTVQAFCYINWNWCDTIPAGLPQWGNAQINMCPVGPQYQQEIEQAGKKYFNADTKDATLKRLGISNDTQNNDDIQSELL